MTDSKLHDIEAIRRLMADYCHLVDDGDIDGWLGLFEPDAEVQLGRRTHTGIDEIRTWIVETKAAQPAPTRHYVANAAIDVDGDGATSVSDWMIFAAPTTLLAVGRYDDTFARAGDSWRIARRSISFLRA